MNKFLMDYGLFLFLIPLLFIIVTSLLSDARKLTLQINDSGIFDESLNVGWIDWHDVVECQIVASYRNVVLTLKVQNPDKYIERMPPSLRTNARQKIELGFTRFAIDLRNVEVDLLQLKKDVDKKILSRRIKPTLHLTSS